MLRHYVYTYDDAKEYSLLDEWILFDFFIIRERDFDCNYFLKHDTYTIRLKP